LGTYTVINFRKRGIFTDNNQNNGEKLQNQTEFINPLYTDFGSLIVNVTAASEAFPVANATVVVSSILNGYKYLYRVLHTDSSGRTPEIILPAPPFELSQRPDSDILPYALYDIETSFLGFRPVEDINVPIYPQTKAVQYVNLIPNGNGAEILPFREEFEIVNENTPIEL